MNLTGLIYIDVPEHRGFRIGAIAGPNGYRAVWFGENTITEGHILVDSIDEIPRLARECIDFRERQRVLEGSVGRELTMEELKHI